MVKSPKFGQNVNLFPAENRRSVRIQFSAKLGEFLSAIYSNAPNESTLPFRTVRTVSSRNTRRNALTLHKLNLGHPRTSPPNGVTLPRKGR